MSLITGPLLNIASEQTDFTTPSELELALAVIEWDANCPPYYRGLLNAGEPDSKFTYDSEALRYMDKHTHHILTPIEVSNAFEVYLNKVSEL